MGFANSYFGKKEETEEEKFSKKATSIDDFAAEYFGTEPVKAAEPIDEIKREPTPPEMQERMRATELSAEGYFKPKWRINLDPLKPVTKQSQAEVDAQRKALHMFARPMLSSQTAGLSEHVLPSPKPEGFLETALAGTGSLAGFITGAPLKIGGMGYRKYAQKAYEWCCYGYCVWCYWICGF